MFYNHTLICRHVSDPALAMGAMRATPEASSGQVPEAGSGQALQGRERKVKNEVGALATSIIYQPQPFSIAEFGINRTRYSLA